MIAIADEQSTRDDTLTIQFYSRYNFELQGHGLLPQEKDQWYNFRVGYDEAFTIYFALSGSGHIFEIYFPVYFGCKDELTDERGFFNVAKAEELVKLKCELS